MAFQIGLPLLLLLVGICYFFEAVSVILQVGYYKLTHKRLFLMAPFHHHLEKKGLSEEKIVIFSIFVTIISSIFSIFAL
jgi:phospho-N-acetylmuramoyl-pentapeptide-transferase